MNSKNSNVAILNTCVSNGFKKAVMDTCKKYTLSDSASKRVKLSKHVEEAITRKVVILDPVKTKHSLWPESDGDKKQLASAFSLLVGIAENTNFTTNFYLPNIELPPEGFVSKASVLLTFKSRNDFTCIIKKGGVGIVVTGEIPKFERVDVEGKELFPHSVGLRVVAGVTNSIYNHRCLMFSDKTKIKADNYLVVTILFEALSRVRDVYENSPEAELVECGVNEEYSSDLVGCATAMKLSQKVIEMEKPQTTQNLEAKEPLPFEVVDNIMRVNLQEVLTWMYNTYADLDEDEAYVDSFELGRFAIEQMELDDLTKENKRLVIANAESLFSTTLSHFYRYARENNQAGVIERKKRRGHSMSGSVKSIWAYRAHATTIRGVKESAEYSMNLFKPKSKRNQPESEKTAISDLTPEVRERVASFEDLSYEELTLLINELLTLKDKKYQELLTSREELLTQFNVIKSALGKSSV